MDFAVVSLCTLYVMLIGTFAWGMLWARGWGITLVVLFVLVEIIIPFVEAHSGHYFRVIIFATGFCYGVVPLILLWVKERRVRTFRLWQA